MRTPRRNDTLSRDTEFAGLPKSALMYLSGSQIGAVGTILSSFDTVAWNDGPFTPKDYAGFPALLSGWTVQEPGIYDVQAQTALTSGGQFVRFSLNTPGTNPHAIEVSRLANSTAGIDTMQFRAPMKMKAGDFVTCILTQNVAFNTFATYQWLYIEKKGGQY